MHNRDAEAFFAMSEKELLCGTTANRVRRNQNELELTTRDEPCI